MKTLLFALIFSVSALAHFSTTTTELRGTSINKLVIDDVTGTGLIDIHLVMNDGKVFSIDTRLTNEFIIKQCLEGVRAAMSSDSLRITIEASGSESSARIYTCTVTNDK